ncbi:ATPase family gene 2 protein homolog A-like isoform X3 [Oscarella lobularis]|uniref:ATPase family gene 2 protein homolog A-like isoform X3 n=1 Tax=Oscarella lobularis TaxID=121494 RepID=UPI003313890E
MPPKSKKASKRRTLEWISSPTRANCLVPGYANVDGAAEEGNSESTIHSGILDAIVGKLHETLLSDNTPKRADFIYINPSTQQKCHFGIGDPVLLYRRSLERSTLCVAFPWPVAKVPLDNVSIGVVTRENCQVDPGDSVCIAKLSCPVPIADSLRLTLMYIIIKLGEPACLSSHSNLIRKDGDPAPNEKIFLDYLKYHLEGRILLPGNCVQVNHYGKPRKFVVTDVDGANGCMNGEELMGWTDQISMSTPVKSPEYDESEISISTQLSSFHLDSEQDLDDPLPSSPSSPLPRLAFAYKIGSRTNVILGSNDSNRQGPTINPIGYNDIGGLEGPIQQIRETVELPLKAPKLFSSLGVSPPRGVLLHGPTGTGKSLLARAVAFESKAYVVAIEGPEVMSRYFGETEARLRELFQEASSNSPAIVLIDELDALCPSRDAVLSDFEKRVVATLCTLMDGVSSDKPEMSRVVIVAATSRLDAVDPALRRPGRFDREIEIGIPTAVDRLQIMKTLLRTVPHCLSDCNLEEIADLAHGHVGADLAAVCKEAALAALKRALKDVDFSEIDASYELPDGSATITFEDIKSGLRQVRPSAMREVVVDVPKVYWTDVGGQDHVKQKLKEAIEWPLRHPEAFSRLGIEPPRGLLMYGPPGCSKTLIAKALATESGLNFISVKGPELLSQWVGESEKAVRQVFKKARAAAPSVVFFDEIDALAIHRGSDGSSVGDRVLSQILTEMDGVEPLKDVIILAATNRPDMIDKVISEVLCMDHFSLDRSLSRLFCVPVGLTRSSTCLCRTEQRDEPFLKYNFVKFRREATSRLMTCRKKQKITREQRCVTLHLSSYCKSLYQIAAICREAALCAMREDIGTSVVMAKHFDAALTHVLPQTSMETIRQFEHFAKHREQHLINK